MVACAMVSLRVITSPLLSNPTILLQDKRLANELPPERLVEVGDNVRGSLQADREPQQRLRRAREHPLDRGPMFDQAVGSPQAGGADYQLQAGSRGKGFIPSTPNLKREHPAEVAHLPAGNRVPRIAFEAGIVNNRDSRVSRQELRHLARILAMQANAGYERLQAAQNDPAVKRGKHRATNPLKLFNSGRQIRFLPKNHG